MPAIRGVVLCGGSACPQIPPPTPAAVPARWRGQLTASSGQRYAFRQSRGPGLHLPGRENPCPAQGTRPEGPAERPCRRLRIRATRGRPRGGRGAAPRRSRRGPRPALDRRPRRGAAAACTLPDSLPIAAQVAACAPLLAWTCWDGKGLARDISRRLFTTERLGPDGHIPAQDVRVGLLVSEPWVDYSMSRHSGEETYLVLLGTAECALNRHGCTARGPGTLIHHPAWHRHGRRTRAEPFLGARRWSGDLDLSSFSAS